MNKIIFEIVRCTIYFSIPIFLTYLIKIIKSISKKKKEEAELVSLKTVNEIIQTVVMSLEQTRVKSFKKNNNHYKLDDSQKDTVKRAAIAKINNILYGDNKLNKFFDIVELNQYIDEMIERKVLELSLNSKNKKNE